MVSHYRRSPSWRRYSETQRRNRRLNKWQIRQKRRISSRVVAWLKRRLKK